MNFRSVLGLVAPFCLLLLCLAEPAILLAQDSAAQTLIVSAEAYPSIEAALSEAHTGDTIEVHGGVYNAPLSIEKSVRLIGIDNPVIDGHGTGSLVLINAPDVVFQGFSLRNTGTNLEHEDTAIVAQAPRILVADNLLENVLFGIYFADAPDGIAERNDMHCIPLDPGIRGDGIRVWYSHRTVIRDNRADFCRDMLFWYSDDLLIQHNRIADSRYGLHFMYNNRVQVLDNQLVNNTVGAYFMYSDGLTIERNQMLRNRGISGYGIALKEANEVTISENLLVDNLVGIYIDNSPTTVQGTNSITNNVIALNTIGITAQPSVHSNIFTGNAFLDNDEQAATSGRGNLQRNTWTVDGAGNYWSDYAGYDQNHDGIGDLPYRSEKLFESLADENEMLRLFAYSPAAQAVEFGSAAFPSLRPDPKLVDNAPLLDWTLPHIALEDSSATDSSFDMTVTALALLATGGLCIYVLRPRYPRPFAQ